MKFIIFFLLFNFNAIGSIDLNSKQLSYWHKLGHYRKNLIGQYVSEIDSLDFFVSKEGKKSPAKELQASVDMLNSDKGQDFVCRYPLRYRWLRLNVPNAWKFDDSSCAVYQSFKGKIAGKNISLVFSSFHINNPGSTFGHTFLRVSRYKEFRTNELLDYAINFAAQETNDFALLYIIKGLTGFYPGKFSVVPYYYKIREYSDHEFRDVWDYDLGLNQDQIDRVVDHVWELGNAYFAYFYFTENCSYHIFGLLNVAYEDHKIDLIKGLSPLYVLPIDTVKEMKKLKLIKDRKVRVSAYGKLLHETKDMKSAELDKVRTISEHPSKALELLKGLDNKKAAGILDASISALDYLKAEAVLTNDPKVTDQRRELLIMRSENPEISEDIQYDEKKMNPPEESHGSSRLGFFAGDRYKDGAFTGFEWRAAQHDLLDPTPGQLRNSQVIMFDWRIRYETINFETNKWVIDRFRAIDLKKYQASDFWNDSISWDLSAGVDQRKECKSRDCLNPVVTFGAGTSVEVTKDYIFSFLLGGSYLRDRIYENDSLLSLGPKMNLLVLKDSFSLSMNAGYFLPSELFEGWLKRRISYDLDARYFLNRNTALFFKTNNLDQDVGTQHEGQVGVYFYH